MSDATAHLDATAQAELVRRGDATPLELVDAAIARIERLDPEINAVIHRRFDKARDEAASPALSGGPFRGVPIVLKDMVSHSAGDPFHCGMRFLRDRGWTATEDTHLVSLLRAAGFVIVGRTNVPELAVLPACEPEAYGATHNPWNPEHSSGGSSGGSAAAVAARMVPLAHATDSGGSIRIPASECGLVGLKPSRGRISAGPGAAELVAGLGVEFAVTRTVRDAAALLDVLAAPLPGDPPGAPPPERPYAAEARAHPGRLRVGFVAAAPSGVTPVHADCVAAVTDAAHMLASLGHTVSEDHPAAFDEVGHILHFGAVTGADAAAALDAWSERTGSPIGPDDVETNTWAIAEMGRAVSAPQLLASLEWLGAYRRRMAAWWEEGFDLLLTPTIAEPPPRLGEFFSTREAPFAGGLRGGVLVPFTPPFNSTGQPAITLPLAWNAAGLPVGVQIVAACGREDLLLRVAAQLEAARPWAERRPAVSA